jgi:transcriptional regulator with XRE-family HTH domain
MLSGPSLGGSLEVFQVLAKGGLGHGCKYVPKLGTRSKQEMYPTPVLDADPPSAHFREMAISLKKARKDAGLSQTELGEAVRSGRSTIVKLEQGTLPLTEAWAKRLAPVLGIRASELLKPPQIPVVGFVGAGQRVYAFSDYESAGEEIDKPPYADAEDIAVEVRGDSMLPLAEDGWHVVYTQETTLDERTILNRVCIVCLEDDVMLVKRVVRGTQPQHYHLISTNAAAIEDVRLKWAAVVRAIVPR